MVTLEDLERRLSGLEQQATQMRQLLEAWFAREEGKTWFERALAESRASQPYCNAILDEMEKKMGVPTEPVSREEIRRLWAEEEKRRAEAQAYENKQETASGVTV